MVHTTQKKGKKKGDKFAIVPPEISSMYWGDVERKAKKKKARRKK